MNLGWLMAISKIRAAHFQQARYNEIRAFQSSQQALAMMFCDKAPPIAISMTHSYTVEGQTQTNDYN